MTKKDEQIRLEILRFSHYEHFKAETELSKVLGADDPKRIRLAKATSEILGDIHKMQDKKKPKKKS